MFSLVHLLKIFYYFNTFTYFFSKLLYASSFIFGGTYMVANTCLANRWRLIILFAVSLFRTGTQVAHRSWRHTWRVGVQQIISSPTSQSFLGPTGFPHLAPHCNSKVSRWGRALFTLASCLATASSHTPPLLLLAAEFCSLVLKYSGALSASLFSFQFDPCPPDYEFVF